MTELAIKVQNLSKCYPIYAHPPDRLKQFVMPGLQRMAGQEAPKQYYREFWALQKYRSRSGKAKPLASSGGNGSGKSILLQMICGMLKGLPG
jgi:lipopolysaccharide transport system ATP-binding protein